MFISVNLERRQSVESYQDFGGEPEEQETFGGLCVIRHSRLCLVKTGS